jgi:TonB family protein
MKTNTLHKALRIACTMFFLCLPLFAQETPQPFASVDAAFKKSRLRWSEASTPFQQERTRLGQNFEPELWKYLGEDVDKQDKISNFLLYPGYLHGNLPMPYLAMQIQLKSLSIVRGRTDLSSRIMYVTTSVNAAILDGALDLVDQAEIHKAEAETMMARDKFLSTGFPAIDDYDRCIYDSIGHHEIASPASSCASKKTAGEPNFTLIEVGEIPNEKFTRNPKPRWPSSARAEHQAGVVTVELVIDENGSVETADALSGPSDLQPAALKAARGAQFQKTLYQGQAVKVRGWATYQF